MTQSEFNEMYKRTIRMWDGAYYEKLENLSNDAQEMRRVFNRVKIVSYRYCIDYADALCALICRNKL